MVTPSRKWKVESDALWFHVAQAVCAIAGVLLLALGAGALRGLELTKAQSALAGAVFLSVMLQWGVLTVVIMMFLDPKRRAA